MDPARFFPILSLPSELKRRTATYLCPTDALKLSETCRNLHVNLSLRLLRDSRPLFPRQSFQGSFSGGDCEIPFIWVPCISRRVHSITVSFRWRDQGWGYRKGKVWIIARRQGTPTAPNRRFDGGRVVCESGNAPHDAENTRMTFLTNEGEAYQMWYRVGSGGGHQLMLFDASMRTVIFDDQQGNISRNYSILRSVGAIVGHHRNGDEENIRQTFYPQLLLHTSRSLRLQLVEQQSSGQVAAVDETMASFFHMYSIPVTEQSLLAVEEIVQSDLDLQALPPVEPPEEEEEEEEDDDDDDDGMDFMHGFMHGGGFVRGGEMHGLPPGLEALRFALGGIAADVAADFPRAFPVHFPPGHDDEDDEDEESADTYSDLPPLERREGESSDSDSEMPPLERREGDDDDDDPTDELPPLVNQQLDPESDDDSLESLPPLDQPVD